MRRLLTIMLGMIMIFAMVGCGGNNNNGGAADNGTADNSGGQTADAAQMTILIDIDYPDASGKADVDDVKIQVAEGSSVLDALNAYASANECEVVMSDSSATAYVTSIGGVAATDTAGWMYEVNDTVVMESADACILKNGDEVSWEFSVWGE